MIGEAETRLNERSDQTESRLNERSDKYESAVDGRLDERLSAFEKNSDQRFETIELRLDERLSAVEQKIDSQLDAITIRISERFDSLNHEIDRRLDGFEQQTIERLDGFDGRINERLDGFDARINDRLGEFDSRMTERFESFDLQITDRFSIIEKRADDRAAKYESALDQRIDERLKHVESRVDQRFEERARSVDSRLDDRFAKIERHFDERFDALEERSDDRMEQHERKVDSMIRQMSTDIVERNDVMLQIFDNRLDKQRREMRQIRQNLEIREHHTPSDPSEKNEPDQEESSEEGEAANDSTSSENTSPSHQIHSFRKLANAASSARARIKSQKSNGQETALYNKILSWKKIAHEGINEFTPDEQETIDFILSFIDDPKEINYVQQHLRRFVATLQRIPPAQRSTDRLLELGSLAHLAPAIKKYCGYNEIHRADFWDSKEKLVKEAVRQKNGGDTYAFELRNFNAERDRFPYEDGYFKVVLCCEMIEHLMSDPMHMLWECNRVLDLDGYLLLTTPNIAGCRAIEGLLVGCAPYLLAQYNVREVVDQHNREYAPYEIGVALAAAGFSVVELETEDVWLRSNPAIIDLLKQIDISTELRGDNIFALARKKGSPIERYPKELYID
ncbi:MAG: methyltransferase domain-containing protein [Acidobacteria bacterium]|nr:methyltransferase domain-containing protein [Acidobacteriota bacterium]